MKFLFAAVLMLTMTFVGCNKPSDPTGPIAAVGCSVETAITSSLAATIGSTLTCSNLTQVQLDIQGALGKANLCAQAVPPPASAQSKQKFKGIVGGLVCPLAIDAVLGLVVSKVPASWGCSPSASTTGLATALGAACVAVVGI